jgi:hypothetical protein
MQVLLARLEGGVYVPQGGPRAEYEAAVRQLYLRTQDQVRILADCLELELE